MHLVSRGAPIRGTTRFKGVPCERPAVLRVLLAHGPGVAKYGNRCGLHDRGQMGPLVAAVWDPLRGEWVERQLRLGSW